MFIDASVLVGIINGEEDADVLMSRLESVAGPRHISPLVRFEAIAGVARNSAAARGVRVTALLIDDASRVVDALLLQLEATEIAITDHVGVGAIEASKRYGKIVGHPARLNLGDCFAYACAKSLGVPLLYKSSDFARTDLA
jgi:ribonuclease VapC